MVKFCIKCGTYIPVNQTDCPRCGAAEKFTAKQMNPKELTVDDVLENFPAPSLRPYQKEIIVEAIEAFGSGKKCILLAAPTGFGKSYVNATFTSVSRSFYATPQLALIDQILADPYLKSRFVEIKGRQNYQCYYQPQRRVHVGKCETEDYPCTERFQVCPYWIQKIKALNAPSVLLSIAYLIAEGQTEGVSDSYLGTRTLMVLDEAHNIEEQCLSHVSVRLTPFTVPYEIYNQFLPQLRDVKSDAELKELLETVETRLATLLEYMNKVTETSGLTVSQAQDKGVIERYLANYGLYKRSKSEWVWQIRNDQLLLQPIYAREFMKDLLWKRAEYYIISSATILHPAEFTELTGLRDILDDDEIAFLQVPSTFPVENRPVIDVSVGPLSRNSLEVNMPDAVRVVDEILRRELGNVAIHCHSYRHQEWLVKNLSGDIRPRLIVHTSRDREEKLREWMSSRGKVFVSVAFSEGQDWKYDMCLLPDEEIITASGVKRIREIRIGEKVLTHRGRFREVRAIKVRNYDGKVTSITPNYAKEFTVTPEHPILTDRGWIKAAQLSDERIAYPRLSSRAKKNPRVKLSYIVRKPGFHRYKNSGHSANSLRQTVKFDRKLTPRYMRLFGYYLAEGFTAGHQTSFAFGKTEKELGHARDTANLLGELFGKPASVVRAISGYRVTFDSVGVTKWFQETFGTGALRKKIPNPWLHADTEFIIELLRGYFRGDGFHYDNVVGFTTTSKTLAYQVKLLLAKFGIMSSVTMQKKTSGQILGRTVDVHDLYHVRVSRTQANQALQVLGISGVVPKKHRFEVKANMGRRFAYIKVRRKKEKKYSGPVFNLEVDDDSSYVGVSCIYHNCDAQILLKVPFADIGDRRVKRRLELGQRQWYENQAMLEVIQAYGRAIRAEDDRARFYVVDGSFARLVANCWPFIPDWFKEVLPSSLTPKIE